ncbi:serine hydrolase, partial [Escherichia coli]|uniref:serine hydrolase n=1 Tax=Escherichia coli TaxID=562 RepID=UPI001953145C
MAGAIAVAATGQDYRTLMRRHVLDPLELCGAGFDRPLRDGSQPVEHRYALWGKKWVALKPGRRLVDDLEIVRPSGDVHGRIADLARYGGAHLRLLADPVVQA